MKTTYVLYYQCVQNGISIEHCRLPLFEVVFYLTGLYLFGIHNTVQEESQQPCCASEPCMASKEPEPDPKLEEIPEVTQHVP